MFLLSVQGFTSNISEVSLSEGAVDSPDMEEDCAIDIFSRAQFIFPLVNPVWERLKLNHWKRHMSVALKRGSFQYYALFCVATMFVIKIKLKYKL